MGLRRAGDPHHLRRWRALSLLLVTGTQQHSPLWLGGRTFQETRESVTRTGQSPAQVKRHIYGPDPTCPSAQVLCNRQMAQRPACLGLHHSGIKCDSAVGAAPTPRSPSCPHSSVSPGFRSRGSEGLTPSFSLTRPMDGPRSRP